MTVHYPCQASVHYWTLVERNRATSSLRLTSVLSFAHRAVISIVALAASAVCDIGEFAVFTLEEFAGHKRKAVEGTNLLPKHCVR